MNKSEKLCSVTLRIASNNHSANDISLQMGVDATELYELGELISSRSPIPHYRKESMWLLKSDVAEEHPLEEHIEALLSFVETKEKAIKLLKLECDIEAFCCFSSDNGQGGFVLDNVLLEKMAQSTIDFVFDLYLYEE